MANGLSDQLKQEYQSLFGRMSLRRQHLPEIDGIYRAVIANSAVSKYKQVESAIGVPWFVVGIIHNLEASLRFDRHLHNGDRLTAKTVRVPAGRPRVGSPPFKWHDSAIDALKMKKLEQWTDWSVAGIAYVLENYNGWGYRKHHPHVKTPYLWSFTTNYVSGKYVADGQFSDDAVSRQCGGMALLRYLMEKESSVASRVAFEADDSEDDNTSTFPKIDGPEESDTPSDPRPTSRPPYPERYLVRDESETPPIDPDVRVLQIRLRDLGITIGIDGQFGLDTEEAVKLFQARSTNAQSEPLEIDGIVGPETWEALFGPGSVPATADDVPIHANALARAVLDIASGEIGVREKPLGSNRGPRVDDYIRSVGLNPTDDSYPWCMCFVYFCFKTAASKVGVTNLVPKTGGVHLAWNGSRNLGDTVKVIKASEARRNPALVKPGMVFFIDTGGNRGHVGIVSVNDNGMLETIEGNTNEGGSREGIGVFRRNRRRISNVNLGFVDFTPRGS